MEGPQSVDDYKQILSDLIKRQISLLGPQLAIGRARVVAGITIADDGTVTDIAGDPKMMLQKVVDEYFIFSGLIVRKTMESLLQSSSGIASSVNQQVATQT